MSGDTRVTGEIRIDPPIPVGKLSTSLLPLGPWLPEKDADIALRIVESAPPEIRDDAVVVHHHADAIVPAWQEQSAYHLVEDVQAVVATWGAGRTFTGHFDCVWAGGEEIWRVVVEDGQAKQVKPIFAWPGDEDLVARLAVVLCNQFCHACHDDRDSVREHGEQARAVIAALAGGGR